jgi:hypothetical protein
LYESAFVSTIQQYFMQLSAKLIQLLPLQSGTGKNGQWKKQDIIVETDGQYPKKICVSVWGEKINEDQLKVGNRLKIDFDVESREYNGRWYTDVKAWKIEVEGASGNEEPDLASNNYNEGDENEGLPF